MPDFDTLQQISGALGPASDPGPVFSPDMPSVPGHMTDAGWAPLAPAAFSDGRGGMLPDGSVTKDPSVYARWAADHATMRGGTANNGGSVSEAPDASFEASPLGQKLAAATKAASEPEPISTKKTGFLANVGAGTSEGVAGALGMPVDLATSVLNLPANAVNAVAGTHLPTIDNPVGGSDWWKSAEGKIGADPRDVEPEGFGSQMARAAARGATAMVLPGAVAGALPAAGGALGAVQRGIASGSGVAGGVTGAGAGVGGQMASDVVPERWKPLADFLGQLGGGLVGGLGAAAGQGAGRLAGMAKERLVDPLSVGSTQTVTDPTAGATATGTRRQLRVAGRSIAGGMGMEPREAAASIPAPDEAAMVPGSTPTIGQATGNTSALNYERKLQGTGNKEAFTEADAANNAARLKALRGLAPEDAADAARQHFRDAFAQMQADDAAEIAGHQATAERAVGGLPGAPATTSVQTLGAEQRAALEAERKPEKTAAGRALDAVDPDGTLALDVSKVGEAARKIKAEVNERMGGSLAAVEAPVLDAAASLRGVELFSDLRALLSHTSQAQRAIRKSPEFGAESPPYRRMTMLRAAIEDAMTEAAAKSAETDQHLVNAGAMAPDESIMGRVNATVTGTDDAAEAVGTAGAGSNTGLDGNAAGANTPGAAGASRGQAQGQGGRGSLGGDSDLAAAPAIGRTRAPETLHDFVISQGGVRDQAGEYVAQDLDRVHHRAGGRLVNNTSGIPEDEMARRATEAGFFRANADLNDFREGMASKSPVYRLEEAHDAAYRLRTESEARREADARYEARDDVAVAADRAGIRVSQAELDHATELRLQGEHPEDALRQAVTASEDTLLQRNAEKNAIGHPGLPPNAEQATLGIDGKKPLAANFDAEASSKLRAANAMYARYKNTWGRGAVGEVLATGNAVDGYRLVASDVPARLFRPGVRGAEAADSLIKAAGSPEKALELLGDYPAYSLRAAAEKDGALNLKAYERWVDIHKAVLDKFPDLRRQFETVADAQRAVEGAQARHVERWQDMQDSAARFYLNKAGEPKDVQSAITDLMGSKTSPADAAALLRAVSKNKAAFDGVQRNVADWLMAKARSTAEAGSTGEKEIAGGTFQRLISDPKTARTLEEVFDADQMKMIRAVGRDIERSARSVNATKIKGSPGTASDLHAAGDHDGISMLVQMELADHAAGGIAHALGAGSGLGALAEPISAIGSVIYNIYRNAGLRKVDQIATQGVLNPELGRVLLQRAATDPKAPIWAAFRRRLAATTLGASETQ